MQQAKTKRNRFREACAYLVYVGLSLAFATSPYYLKTGECSITGALIVSTIAYFIVFVIIDHCLRKKLYGIHDANQSNDHSSIEDRIDDMLSCRKSVVILALIMAIFWLPAIASLYPGTLINDSFGQIQLFIRWMNREGALSNHHPLFDTFVIGGLISLVHRLTHNWQLAFFIYVIIQMICTCLSFSYSIVYAYRKLNIGTKLTIAVFLFYSLMPMYPASVQTVSKDALHAWVFCLFFVHYIEIIRSKGLSLSDKWFVCRFVLLSILCCLTKKVGVYVTLISVLAFLLYKELNRLVILLSLVIIIAIMFVMMPLAMKRYGVAEGGRQEMLSIPFQQTARYVIDNGDSITDEEYTVLNKVLDVDSLADNYNPLFADPIKGYSPKGDDGDYKNYLKVWLKEGLNDPKAYITAFNAMESGWFSWYEYDPLMNMVIRSQLDTRIIPEKALERRGIFQTLGDSYQEMYHSLYDNPFLRVFFTYGFYSALLPAFAVITIIRRGHKKKMGWLMLLPIVLSIALGCWLAPASVWYEGRRYLYPITYIVGLLVAIIVFFYQKEEEIE